MLQYRKLIVDRKILGWMWSPAVVDTLVTGWMDEWMDELSWFFACSCKFRKVKNYFYNFWVVVVRNGHGTLISEWVDKSSWIFACCICSNPPTLFQEVASCPPAWSRNLPLWGKLMSKFSIFCKNSNIYRKLLRLLVF